MSPLNDISWLDDLPIAHRGLHDLNKLVFENTLSAFSRAVDNNYAIECDLQFSADGVPMVFHDYDLERLCGLRADTRSKMAYELTMLSVGGTKDRIPTLKALLDLVDGKVPLILELKGSIKDDYGFAGAILDDLEAYKGKVALMSFDQHLLRDFYELDCPFPVGLTAEGKEPDIFFTHEEALTYNISFISYRIEDLPNPFVEGQRKQGKKIISWTVSDLAQQTHSDLYADQITFEGFEPNR
jgi:glycerophosphoryl diester phosphodiesterase